MDSTYVLRPQRAKVRVMGYTTVKNYYAMIHLVAGKLNFNLPQ